MRQRAVPGGRAVLAGLVAAVVLVAAGCASGHHGRHGAGASSPAPSRTAESAARSPASTGPGFEVPGTVAGCPAARGHQALRVASAGALASALASASPGETIMLAPGTYLGNFVAAKSGTPSAPITLCGSRRAVLAGPEIRHGYVFYLDSASWWRLDGFTVRGGQKGIVTDHASHDVLYGLYVSGTGDEAVHLRSLSSDDLVSHCVIRHTGLLVQFFGEGVYVGSANKNWCRYTACKPDASDHDQILDNDIADTTAENIDIKEGTTGGVVSGNHFDGAGMVASAATAWVNVKGNDWVIKDNTGVTSVGDGFAVHQVYPGWGIGNVFAGNHARVDGPGYGIYVQSRHLGTTVACDNVAVRAASGQSDVPCSPAK